MNDEAHKATQEISLDQVDLLNGYWRAVPSSHVFATIAGPP